ncbi:MAG: hypothetical protein II049_06095 [Clostridia bacterium]|nr:hypothetical protein [Clostridia bacterium]
MKKRILMILMLLMLFAACYPAGSKTVEVQPAPAVLIGKYTYYWTGIEVKELPEGAVSGRIGSVVPETVVPTHSDEANIDCLDAPYIYLDDGIALYLNGQWIFFRPE